MDENPYRAPAETETKVRRRFRPEWRWSTAYLAAILAIIVGGGIYCLKMAAQLKPDPFLTMPRSLNVLFWASVMIGAGSIARELWRRMWLIESGED